MRLRDPCAEHAPPVPALSAGQRWRGRALRDAYERRWQETAPGDTLEVEMSDPSA